MNFTIETAEPKPIEVKKIAKRTVAIALILLPLYHIYLSIKDILFVLPKINFIENAKTAEGLYFEMIKKAIVISTGLFLDSFYGFALLVRPGLTTKYVHILLGVVVFFFSIYVFNYAAIDKLLNYVEFLPLT